MSLLFEIKQKNIIIEFAQIFVVWFFVTMCTLLWFIYKGNLFSNFDNCALFVIFIPLIILLLALICYSPYFLFIRVLFKKILSKKNRILFLLVFTSIYTILLNYFILHQFGLILYFLFPIKIFLRLCYAVFIHSTFLTLLFIPKKIFYLKWEALLLFVTTFVFVKIFYYFSKILFH